MKHVFCFVALLFFNSFNCDPTVDLYEKLIKQRVEQADKFVFPTENQEFKSGYQSQVVVDLENEYDFIIVGAGTAGNVLAERLSEVKFWKILVIEAGGEETLVSMIPSLYGYTLLSKLNWGYFSTPQKKCCQGMRNKQCMIPRGKVLGGSSSINAVMYARGNAEDYNNWAKLGNPGWSFEDVLPYFKKSENCQVDGDEDFHGYGGLWNNQYADYTSDTHSNFIEGNKQLNQETVDYNGCQQLGVSKLQLLIKKGQRQSTRAAFLDYATERNNLHVITEALVTKILINKRSRIAEGVVFVKGDKKYKVKANIEVILSGGTINSPQLLMLSGIGPEEHLKANGIETIADLSQVGKNMIDHPLFPGLTFHTNYSAASFNLTHQIEQYLKGKGPLTGSASGDGVGFLKVANPTKFYPIIEYIFLQMSSPNTIFDKLNNFDVHLSENYVKKINFSSDIIYYLVLLHPESRGDITLKSNNPIDFPNINVNLFDKYRDIKEMIRGIRFILKLMDTEPFQKLNATLIDTPVCGEHEKYSDKFWECLILRMASTIFHPVGTCRMGPNAETSVVDSEGRVYGINKLRVVDASIIPVSISGHLVAPTVMVAEKISDIIKRNSQATKAGNISEACKISGYCDWNTCF